MPSNPRSTLVSVYRKMPRTPGVIRGNLIWVKRSCGQRNCRCQRGFKHASWYLSQSIKGKTRMTYLPRAVVEKVRQYTQNHGRIKEALEELSKINLRLILKGR